jgi:hypothetical protein
LLGRKRKTVVWCNSVRAADTREDLSNRQFSGRSRQAGRLVGPGDRGCTTLYGGNLQPAGTVGQIRAGSCGRCGQGYETSDVTPIAEVGPVGSVCAARGAGHGCSNVVGDLRVRGEWN